jgi:predicted benzoate:H+ symporter BenE
MHEFTDAIKHAQRYAKAIVAGVGSVLIALTGASTDLGVTLIPTEAQAWVTFALAALTAFSTWAVPNFNPDGD